MSKAALRIGALVLLAATSPVLAGDGEGVVKDEEFNFEIHIPDSPDWEIQEISDSMAKVGQKAHLRTFYADSDPQATCDVILIVSPIHKSLTRYSPAKIAKMWQKAMESHLDNPRDRSEKAGKLGGVESWVVDVKGDHLAGLHQRTWMLAKNGKFIYLLYIDRNYDAVGDEFLDEELAEILGSFKFLRIEKVEANKEAGKGVPEALGGADSKVVEEQIDPELLKRETFKEPFWRVAFVKPEGLVKQELKDDDAKRGIKYHFRHTKDGSRCIIYIYAQTERAKQHTLEKLLESKIKWFKKEVKQAKDPKIDKRFKMKLSKEAIRLDLTGRSKVVIRRIWILAECKNDRQYQLEIYLSGSNALTVWGKVVDEFLKNFKPFKK